MEIISQFSHLLHQYFEGDLNYYNALEEKTIPLQLSNFLSKLFVGIFEDVIQKDPVTSGKILVPAKQRDWNSSGIISVPALSLFDVPHLLTSSDLITTSPFVTFGDFANLCKDYAEYNYQWYEFYAGRTTSPCLKDSKKVNYQAFANHSCKN
jgi:hypothetical protein